MAFDLTVIGAGGAVGMEIVRAARAAGQTVCATIRTQRPAIISALSDLGATIEVLDLRDEVGAKRVVDSVETIIATPILTRSQNIAAYLRPGQRCVFFSSHNVTIDPTAAVYSQLLKAEMRVRESAPSALILRPTMIYGYVGDGNMSKLMRAMGRFPVVPLPGAGTTLQQPVFYKDVARDAFRLAMRDEFAGEPIAVGGPDVVSQRAIYDTIAKALGKNPIYFPVPLGAAAACVSAVEKTGLRLPVSSAQLQRAVKDKTLKGDATEIIGETNFNAGVQSLARALGSDNLW